MSDTPESSRRDEGTITVSEVPIPPRNVALAWAFAGFVLPPMLATARLALDAWQLGDRDPLLVAPPAVMLGSVGLLLARMPRPRRWALLLLVGLVAGALVHRMLAPLARALLF